MFKAFLVVVAIAGGEQGNFSSEEAFASLEKCKAFVQENLADAKKQAEAQGYKITKYGCKESSDKGA